ncbi:hypothetical protein BBK36DRAFT_1160730 [Trichoderma citrinoviride]|uniref:Uncharacterized protein n=1 Tax=Trichoderma citrinoviride TaxID=58853 RepID=A0A2T4B5F9_9HYPO|nr:hypothetical protein BBK36DRAFT_1160730 [Trichoderma citrinoviride]PTB64566.1 hypothetical protein BBK36DRAFT_1160730 [Trichoderma citrinoviride]
MSVSLGGASGIFAFLSFPGSAFLVSTISWISLALGLFFSVPFVLCVIFDILLWVWRTYCISTQEAQIPARADTTTTNITTKATTTSSEQHAPPAVRR